MGILRRDAPDDDEEALKGVAMSAWRREVMTAVARLRRMMPRNADAMLVCEYVEQVANRVITTSLPVSSVLGPVSEPVSTASKTDRKAYMRDLMRKRRAAARPPT